MANVTNPWLQVFKPKANAVAKLICLPFAGGGAQSFSKWTEQLPDDIELCAIQLPGRETRMREKPLSTVRAVLDALLPSLLSYLDRPFILYGHSMGAIVAFELSRRLQQHSNLVAERLIVSGRVAPHRKARLEPMNALPANEFIDALRRLNGTPAEVLNDPELMALITPMLRADFAINENYVHEPLPRLGCDIVAFGGVCDPETKRSALEDWREVTSGTCTLRMVPGDHFFIVSAQALFLRMLSIELYDVVTRLSLRSRRSESKVAG